MFKYTSGKYPWLVTENIAFRTNIKGYSEDNKYYTIFPTGTVIVKTEYAWNGVSGVPHILQRTIFYNLVLGSCLHDTLYQAIRTGVISEHQRLQADIELMRVWQSSNVNIIIRNIGYALVRIFGSAFAK